MGLADRLSTEMAPATRGCLIGRLLDTLPSADSEALGRAIEQVREAQARGINPQARNGITATAIMRALHAEGHQMSDYTVQAHVYRRCGCGR